MEDMKGKIYCRRRRPFDRSRKYRAARELPLPAPEKGYAIETIELVPHTLAATLKEKKIDIIFNALHGRYGEDGVLQGLCEMMGILYRPGRHGQCRRHEQVMSKAAFKGTGIIPLPFLLLCQSRSQGYHRRY